ncbi:MAG TPA: phosphodiesterase [Dermatophilaceae bacterium]|nr:phosphodiesterase [Dermatophilaceae bacterium]
MGNMLTTASAGAAGWALARVFGVVARLRNSRALHPTGDTVGGELHIVGAYPKTGVPALDQPGDQPVLVRTSRAIGLPEGTPDILGIAVRWPAKGADGGPADLMFASTGSGAVTRYLLGVRTTVHSGPFTTLLPMHGPRGSLLLALFPVDSPIPGRELFDLRYSGLSGRWVSLGSLSIDPQELLHDDRRVRFDTIAHPLAGLPHYDWVARLRSPSYRQSQDAFPPEVSGDANRIQQ